MSRASRRKDDRRRTRSRSSSIRRKVSSCEKDSSCPRFLLVEFDPEEEAASSVSALREKAEPGEVRPQLEHEGRQGSLTQRFS